MLNDNFILLDRQSFLKRIDEAEQFYHIGVSDDTRDEIYIQLGIRINKEFIKEIHERMGEKIT